MMKSMNRNKVNKKKDNNNKKHYLHNYNSVKKYTSMNFFYVILM